MANPQPGTFQQRQLYSERNVTKLDTTWQQGGKGTNEVCATEMGLKAKTIDKIDVSKGDERSTQEGKGKQTDGQDDANAVVSGEAKGEGMIDGIQTGNKEGEDVQGTTREDESSIVVTGDESQTEEVKDDNANDEEVGTEEAQDGDVFTDACEQLVVEHVEKEQDEIKDDIKPQEEADKVRREKDQVIKELEKKVKDLEEEKQQLEKERDEKDGVLDRLDASVKTNLKRYAMVIGGGQGEPQGRNEKARDIERNIEALQSLLERAVKESSRLEYKLIQVQQSFEQEKQRSAQLTRDVQDLANKLSMEMDAKISARESTIENVSIKNRPMNIKEDFSELCSGPWQDAKGDIDNYSVQEADKLQFLCDIIMISWQEAEKLLQSICRGIINPFDEVIADYEPATNNVKELPQNLYTELSDYWKKSSDNITFSKLEQAVFSSLECSSQSSGDKDNQQHITTLWPLAKESDNIKAYIFSSCHVAWNMVIQRPLMRFTADGIGEEWQGEKTQELYWNSSDPESKGAKVKCYMYPVLWHGDKMQSPGKVLVQND